MRPAETCHSSSAGSSGHEILSNSSLTWTYSAVRASVLITARPLGEVTTNTLVVRGKGQPGGCSVCNPEGTRANTVGKRWPHCLLPTNITICGAEPDLAVCPRSRVYKSSFHCSIVEWVNTFASLPVTQNL